MPDFYKGKIPIIHRDLNEGFISGDRPADLGFGCIPRDYSIDPVAMGDSPAGMKLIAESEWDARWEEDEANESSLEHLYLRGGKPAFDHLDQNGFPDCWTHSTAHAIMFDRLKQHLPVPRLNAVAVATMLNQTDGGWCGLSMKWARQNGYPVEGTGVGEWPALTRNRKYDTPELRAAMKLHLAEEDWYDLGRQEWDQKLTRAQLVTCSFNNQPAPSDFNRASHSMCQVRQVRFEPGAWAPLILNTWKGFGYFGLAVLAGWQADNAVALRFSTPGVK